MQPHWDSKRGLDTSGCSNATRVWGFTTVLGPRIVDRILDALKISDLTGVWEAQPQWDLKRGWDASGCSDPTRI